MSEEFVLIDAQKIRGPFYAALKKAQVRDDVAKWMVEGLIQASLRGIDSHGIRLLPHYLKGFEGGRLNKSPNYTFKKTGAAVGKLDGDHAPGHAAGAEGMQKAIELARQAGIGAVAVHNSSHFGAAAYYAFMAAEQDMIGMSFTNATAHVLPYGGVRPFFGNNPVCLVAPCEGEDPICFDMATTVATFNKVQQYKEQKKNIPIGWAVDKEGRDTEDPFNVESLLPIGAYKGFGLSMMVDILCSLLTGSPSGTEVTAMFDTDMGSKRYLGQFFIAISIAAFEDPVVFKKRLKKSMDDLRGEPKLTADNPVMAPGDPEKKWFSKRSKEGIPVPKSLIGQFKGLGVFD
ncbi:MAG: Ldh family oxidoreductase [Candidatus Margulisiibacteriota bacterium]